jgi:hypothetical protein
MALIVGAPKRGPNRTLAGTIVRVGQFLGQASCPCANRCVGCTGTFRHHDYWEIDALVISRHGKLRNMMRERNLLRIDGYDPVTQDEEQEVEA